jgi:hypothetical protein
MTKNQLLNYLKSIGIFGSGVVGYHFGSKILDNKEIKNEANAQAERDITMNKMENNIQELVDRARKSEDNTNVPSPDQENFINSVDQIKDAKDKIQNNVGSSKEMDLEFSRIDEGLKNISDYIDNFFKGNKKDFLSDFSIEKLYNFLDSLTLLEESAFLHLLVFIVIICCLISIISALFGNEFIQYFKLEEKYPKLSIYFKLRTKFQKYYLAWNIFIILIISLISIGLNLLVFYSKYILHKNI